MNKIFRVIWNHATQTWTAVSELAKCHGKVSSQTDKRQFSQGENAPFFKLSLLSAVILGVFFSVDAYAWKNADDSVAGSQKDHPSVVVIGAGSSYKATADATHTVVIGESSKATTQASVAIGTNANASGGANAVAIGAYATTSGENATSMGVYAKAGAKGVAIGDHTTANGSQSVALGSTVNVSSSQSIGIGNDVLVLGHGSIALGSDDIGELDNISETVQGISGIKQQYEGNWQASDTNVPYGEKVNDKKLYVSTVTTGRASIAIGSQSQALNDWTTVLGARAFANKEAATAIGAMAKAMGNASFAGGFNATAGAGFTVALGTNATASQGEATAIGYDSKATGTNSTVLGYKANATSRDATALGSNATSTGESATSVGRNAFANGINSVAIGKDAVANRENSTSLGVGANATGGNTIAIGRDAKVDTGYHANGGIAIGKNAKSLGNGNLAFGTSAYAGKAPDLIPTDGSSYPMVEYSMAIGDIAKAYANRSLALGVDSLVQNSSTGAIAIGNGTKVYDKNSQGSDQAIAIGFTSNITGASGSVIVGSQSDVKSKHAVSLGYNADIGENKEGAVVLGANSGDTGSSATIATTTSATIDHITYSGFSGAIGTTNNQGRFVSIGNNTAGGQRKLINLAAGEVSPTSTEAINGSQLYALALKQARYFSVNSSLAENRGNNGATGGNSIAIGPKASAVAANGIAIGNNTAASGGGDIVIGNNITSSTSGDKGRSVLIGENVTGTGSQAVALGSGTKAAAQATAIGNEVSAEGRGSIALGADDIGGTLPFTDNIQGIAGLHTAYGGTYTNTKATTAGGIAIGAGAQSTGVGAAAIGTGSRSSGILSAALGPLASASADLSVAIGVKASATQAGGVALGTDSLADRSGGDAYKGYDIATNAASTETIPAWKPSYSAVSVGKSGKTRQIINVAAGKEDTDAVNVAQLKKARISTTYKADGGLSNNALNTAENLKSYEVKSGDTKNIEFLSSLDWGTGETAFGGNNIEILHQANGKFQFGIKKQPTFEKLTISNGPVLSSTGIAMNNKKISGLANGADAADAVNKGQLDASIGTFTFKGEKVNTGTGADTTGDTWRSNATKTFMLGSAENWGGDNDRYSGDNIEVLRKDNTNFHIGLKTNATFDSVSISSNGPKLSSTGLDMKNKTITNLTSGGSTDTNAANIADVKRLAREEVAKIPTSQPLKFRGDDNQDVSRNLGTTLSIKGGSTATDFTDKNIKVTKNTSSDGLSIQMAKNLTDLTDAIFGDANANNLKLNSTGLTLTTAGASSPVQLLGGASGGQLTGLESRTTAAANYGTGTNEGRAATESAVKSLADSSVKKDASNLAPADITKWKEKIDTNTQSVDKVENGAGSILTVTSNGDYTEGTVKGKKYTVALTAAKVVEAVQPELNKKLDKDPTNLSQEDKAKWKAAIDTDTVSIEKVVAADNSGITVGEAERDDNVKGKKYTLSLNADKIKELAGTTNLATDLGNKANISLDNIDTAGKTKIKGLTKVAGSGDISVAEGTEGDAQKFTVSLTADAKAKLDAVNNKVDQTTYEADKANFAKTDLSNINTNGENKIKGLIEVKAKDGDNNLAKVTKAAQTTDNKDVYEVEVTKDDLVTKLGDTFAKADATNITGENVTKWKTALGVSDLNLHYKADKETSTKTTALSTGLHFKGSDGISINTAENGVVNFGITNGGITKDKLADDVKTAINNVDNKANKDATGLSEDDKAKWKAAIDTDTVSIEKVVADTNSGITVSETARDDSVNGKKYTLSLNADKIKELAGTTDLATQLGNKANISLDNINDDGKTKIKGLTKVVGSGDIDVAEGTEGDAQKFTVSLTSDAKTKLDAVNNKVDQATYEADKANFAKTDLSNINTNGENKIKGLIEVKAKDGANNLAKVTKAAQTTDNKDVYEVEVTKDDLVTKLGDTFAKADATNITDDNVNKWKTALGVSDLNLHYKADNETGTKTTALSTGLHFKGSDGISINTENGGVVNFGITNGGITKDKLADEVKTAINNVDNKADKNLGNIDDDGKTVIKNAAKSAVKVTGVDKVTVNKEIEDGVDNYKVSVDMSHLATKAELNGTKLKYQANGDATGTTPKEVLLSTGLNFHSEDLTVTTAEKGKVNFAIKTGAITADKIANDAVTGDKIQDGAVTENKLGDDVKNKIAAAKTVVAVDPAADGVLNLNTGTEGQATKYTLSVNGAKLKEMAGTTNLDDRFNGKADTSTAFSLKVKESAGTQEAKKWTLANNGEILFSAGDGLTASKTNEGIQYDLTAAHKATLTKVENQGITFSGDSGTAQTKKLGEGIAVKGGETDTNKLTATTDKNIGVVASANGLEVKLAKNLTALETVTASEKVTVGSGDNTVDIKPNEIAFGKDGTDGKGKGKITGLADPEKGADGNIDKTQAANVGYVDSKLGELNDKPLSFTGNDTETKVARKLGETLTIEGEGSTKEGWNRKDTAANNLYVAAETSKLVVKLAKDLVNLNSVTVGTDTEGTKITKDGTTSKFKDADGNVIISELSPTGTEIVQLDKNGDEVRTASYNLEGSIVNDGQGNSVETTATGSVIKDTDGNTANHTAAGSTLSDPDGNTNEVKADGTHIANDDGRTADYDLDGVNLVDGDKSVEITTDGISVDNGTDQATYNADGSSVTDGTDTTTTKADGVTVKSNDPNNPAEADLSKDGTRIKGLDGKTANYTLDGSTIDDGQGNKVETTATGSVIKDPDGNTNEVKADGTHISNTDGRTADYDLDGVNLVDGDKSVEITTDGISVDNGTDQATYNADGSSVTDGTDTTTTKADGVTVKSNDPNNPAEADLSKDGLTVKGDKGEASYGQDGLTVKGKDGKDAISLVNKEKDGTTTPTLEFAKDGKDGTGVITGLKDLADDADGSSATNKNYVDSKLTALSDKPLSFTGNDTATKVERKLGETLTIEGEVSTKDGWNGKDTAANNLYVAAETGKLVVKLAKDLVNLNSVTVGNDDNGVKITKDGTTIKDGNGNTAETTALGSIFEDKDGNNAALGATGAEFADKDGNEAIHNATGSVIKDTDGNTNEVAADGTHIANDDGRTADYDLDGVNLVDGDKSVEITTDGVSVDNGTDQATYNADGSSVTDGTDTTTTKADGVTVKSNDPNNPAEADLSKDGTRIKGLDGKTANYTLDGSTIDDGQGNKVETTATGSVIKDTDGNTNEVKADGTHISNTDGRTADYDLDGVKLVDGDKSVEVNIDGTTITDGESTTETGADGLTVTADDPNDNSEAHYGKDGLTVKGKDGKDAISLTNKDNGAPTLEFAKNGNDGTGVITGLKDLADDADGSSATNKNYVDNKLTALSDKPLSFTGNDTATKVDRKLGETLTIEGEGSTKDGWNGKDTAANNLYVAAETGKLVVKLAKDLVNLNSVTVGTDNEGTKITKDGTTIKDGNGNTAETTALGSIFEDKDGNNAALGATGAEFADKDGNEAIHNATGSVIKDTDGNTNEVAADGTHIANDDGRTADYDLDGVNLVDGDKSVEITTDGISVDNGTDQATYNADGSSVTDGTDTTTTKADGVTVKSNDPNNPAEADLSKDGTRIKGLDGKTANYTLDSSTIDDGQGNKVETTTTGTTVTDADGNSVETTALGTMIEDKEGNIANHNAKSTGFLDKDGNMGGYSAKGVELEDADGNSTSINAAGTSLADVDGNTASHTAAGSTLNDTDGNTNEVKADGTHIANDDGRTADYDLDGVKLVDGDKSVEVNIDGTTITDGESTTETGADGLTVTADDPNDNSEAHYGKDGLTVKGKDGKDAISLVNKEKDGTTTPTLEFGKDPDGKGTGVITGLKDLADDADGSSATNKNYVDNKLTALSDKPLSFTGNNSDVTVNRKLGEKLTIEGEGSTKEGWAGKASAENNLYVEAVSDVTSNTAKLVVKLAKDLVNLNSVTVGTDTEGTKITKGGTTIKDGNGNTAETTALGSIFEDKDGNNAALGATGAEFADKDGNEAIHNATGSVIKDTDGNTNEVKADGSHIANDDGRTADYDLDGVKLVDGDKSVEVNIDGTTITDGETTTETGADGLTVTADDPNDNSEAHYGKDGLTVKGKDGKDAISLVNKEKDGTTTPMLEFGKDPDDKGTGVITGLKDLADDADGSSATNKNYVDNKVNKATDGTSGIVVYTDGDGNRLVKENGKFYKANAQSEKVGDEVTADKVIASLVNPAAMSDKQSVGTATKLSNIAKGKIAQGSNEAVNGSQLSNLGYHLGLEVNKDGTGFKAPQLSALEGSTTTPTNVVDALNAATDKLNEGITLVGNNHIAGIKATEINKNLGEVFTIVGGYTGTEASANNLRTVVKNGVLEIQMTEKPVFTEVTATDKVTVGTGNETAEITKDGTRIKGLGGKTANYTLDGSTIDDGQGNKVETTATGTAVTDADGNSVETTALYNRFIDKDGNLSNHNARGTGYLDSDGNVGGYNAKGVELVDIDGNEAAYTAKGIDYAKEGEKGTGTITGLKDLDDQSHGTTAVNKNYVDGKFTNIVGDVTQGDVKLDKDGNILTKDEVAKDPSKVAKTIENVLVDSDGKPVFVTHNVDGRGEYIQNDITSAVRNINEQGTKYFHTNDGTNRNPHLDDVFNKEDAQASGKHSTAVGYQAHANGESAVAMGNNAVASAYSIAIGPNAKATGQRSVSVGIGNIVEADSSGAFGDPNYIDGKVVNGQASVSGSYAVGNNNVINSSNTFVLGNNVNNSGRVDSTGKPVAMGDTVENSVYLGNRTTATKGNGVSTRNRKANGEVGQTTTAGDRGTVERAVVGGITYGGFAGATANGVVSVGASGSERRIQNVAAGEISPTSTDAINGSQLYSVSNTLTQGINNMANDVNMNFKRMNNRINDVDRKLRSGIASAVAMGSLAQAYYPGKSLVTLGTGAYRNASALAVGYSRVSDNGKVIIKVSGSVNNAGHYMGGASVGYSF